MTTLYSLFPNADDLWGLSPEDIAPTLLRLALNQNQSAGFIPEQVTRASDTDLHAGRDYPFDKRQKVETFLHRAWLWIEKQGLIEPAPGMNGRNGWKKFTEDGEAIARGRDLARMRAIASFPKDLLHPLIRDRSWAAVVRDTDLADPVRAAFVALEETVREAGGFSRSDYGTRMMRDAFDPDKGPLRDLDATKPKGERAAMAELFAGAYAAFRHAVAHGSPGIDLADATDQLLLASHLLRIVDARSRAP
jgi:hypothetical protein